MTGFWLTDLANLCAFFYHNTPNINWIGFYLSDGKSLRLGPFAGSPACVEIAFNRGVCGAAYTQQKPMIVANVDEFPGHISCDPRSKSELVIPFTLAGTLRGVLDIDSPKLARFTENDQEFFVEALRILNLKCQDINFFN